MKIGIDATIIRKENTGTGYYIINLINGLQKVDKVNQYYIFVDENAISDFINFKNSNIEIINKKFKNRFFRIFWQLFLLPLNLRKLDIKVLHSTNYITPLFKLGVKTIVTIHDLTVIIFPGKHSVLKRLFYNIFIPFFIRKSDKIITVSSNSKNDIIKHFKGIGEKISVTYESYPEYFNNKIDENECFRILKKYNIKKDFILFVGMIEPRKNIIAILKALIDLDKEINLDLVIVGKKGWHYKDISAFMTNKSYGLNNDIIFTGYVPENEIKNIYQSAYIFVYPSIYEGFGLPPLQAMACGVPVITSNTSSLPEVVGEAAIKIDPNNLKELTNSIRQLATDSKLRNELVKKGLRQVKKFKLEEVAEKTLDIYSIFK